MSEFKKAWKGCFGELEPVGMWPNMRFPDCHVRFHSLPQSKQFAETDEDWATLLFRANRLATDVLGSGEKCWVSSSQVINDGHNISLDTAGPARTELSMNPSHEWIDTNELPDKITWSTFAVWTVWKSGKFDSVISKIADELEHDVIWFSPQRCSLFIPYPGGVDVILDTPAKVAALSEKYSDWIAPF